MADPKTQVVITAKDETAAGFASAGAALQRRNGPVGLHEKYFRAASHRAMAPGAPGGAVEARSGKLAWTLLVAALEEEFGLDAVRALFEGGRGPAGAAVTLADDKTPDYTVGHQMGGPRAFSLPAVSWAVASSTGRAAESAC